MSTPQSAWQRVPAPRGQLLECARWLADEQVFQWVDIFGCTVSRWSPTSGAPAVVRDLDLDYVTAALPLADGRSIVASRDALHHFDFATETLEEICRLDLRAEVRFNDGAVAPDGTVFIGTMSMAGATGDGRLYRLEDDRLVEVVDRVGISNGIAWLADGRTLYVDSRAHSIELIDLASTPAHRGEVVLHVGPPAEPDGLTVDPAGRPVVASWGGSELITFEPDGTVVEVVDAPARYPTSAAFGGTALDTLLVTTALHHGDGLDPGDDAGYALYRAVGSRHRAEED